MTVDRLSRSEHGSKTPAHPSPIWNQRSENDNPSLDKQERENAMEHAMTVAEILDALYDSIGCPWTEEGHSFVDEVAAWVENNRPLEGDDDASEESGRYTR